MLPQKAWLTDIYGMEFLCDSDLKENIVTAGITPKTTIRPRWMVLEFDLTPVVLYDKKILVNGFQSWSETFIADRSAKIRRLNPLARLLSLDRYGDYHFYRPQTARKGFVFSHEYLQVFDTEGKQSHSSAEEEILFAGNLSPEQAYGIFEIDFKKNTILYKTDLEGLTLEGGKEFIGITLFTGKTSDKYFDHRQMASSPPARPLTGWTSWYNYYADISEAILLENLTALTDSRIPMDVFQIDDGYQERVGDWLAVKDSFPSGMKFMADRIHEKGLLPGLWLAPFAVEKQSKLYKNQRELLVFPEKSSGQTRRKAPLPAGFNPGWSGIYHALNIYNPSAREYLKEVFKTVVDNWGFRLLKLDFLQAAGVIPMAGKTRAGVMHDAYELLNDLKGEAMLLGCGAPLGPAAGKFEYMRIGSDVAPYWEDHFLKAIGYRERVSTANSLSSTEARAFLNGRAWYNDPDVFYLRDTKDIKMTESQKRKLFETNIKCGGLIFFSDDIRTYSKEKIRALLSTFENR
ncbi:MAG: alpha-galactosidase [Spirochaetales bacterium]|nr:alpha-galactosidase [Spirochaetales bacterium]